MTADAAWKAPEPKPGGTMRRAAVLGAGTMGSRIAAHLANAGMSVVMLDLPGAAAAAFEALKKTRPAAFFDPALAGSVATGSFDHDLAMLADCDWIIEAVAENLDIKRSLLAKAAPHLRSDAILSTNSSGLSIAAIAQSLPPALRSRWLGTHFFNPPRYMRLLEVIPGPETDPAAVRVLSDFADLRLGKEVVAARDTPNFIANRIGVYVMLQAVRLMQEEDLTIEEVDVLTGSAIGWPRTGTFRLADLVGIDVLAHVGGNFSAAHAGEAVEMPGFIRTMIERRWLGDKTGQGFYRKEKGEKGKELRFALDWKTLEYRPASRAAFPALDMLKSIEDPAERIRQILSGDIVRDRAPRFEWKLLSSLWNYAADCLPEIAENCADVDRAMCAGFNWKLGPFAMWDAAGVPRMVERMRSLGQHVSRNAAILVGAGAEAWLRDGKSFDPAIAGWKPAPASQLPAIAIAKRERGVVRRNPGASLVDLGDGVACIELHSHKNAIGEDVVRMIAESLSPSGNPVRDFSAFVIGGETDNFSVGANLMQLLLSAQEGEWDEVDRVVREFQRATSAVKFCPRPVVVAPFGFCLGGGAEIAIHAARLRVHSELYMGLVETGVGLLPAGGGCKEMTIKAIEAAASVRDGGRGDSGEVYEALKRRFETIAMAKVSGSALEARHLGYLDPGDGVTMNRNRLIADAKRAALELAASGYAPPLPRADIPAPGENVLATLKLGIHLMRRAEYISDHDVEVASRVAYVLCGGSLTASAPVSEEYLLDLEREAFLSLCGMRRTQERIAYTLQHGKPLRN